MIHKRASYIPSIVQNRYNVILSRNHYSSCRCISSEIHLSKNDHEKIGQYQIYLNMITWINTRLIRKWLRIINVNDWMPYFLTRFSYKSNCFWKFMSVQFIPASITVIQLQYYTHLNIKVSVKRININSC